MSSQVKPKTKNGEKKSSQNAIFIGVIVGVAVVASVIFIVLSQSQANSGGASEEVIPFLDTNLDGSFATEFSADEIYQWRTADGGFVMGNPDASVTLVEFADFLCPACQAYKPEIDRFIEEFVMTGQANFEYRMIPTQQLSPFVSAVAECAAEMHEGGFYPVHEELFRITRSRAANDSIGRDIADIFDLDYAEMLECTSDAEQLQADGRLGERLGVRSTPTIRIRYADSAPQPISEAYLSGGVPFEVLASMVQLAPAQ